MSGVNTIFLWHPQPQSQKREAFYAAVRFLCFHDHLGSIFQAELLILKNFDRIWKPNVCGLTVAGQIKQNILIVYHNNSHNTEHYNTPRYDQPV